jgi:hypothetical protein
MEVNCSDELMVVTVEASRGKEKEMAGSGI